MWSMASFAMVKVLVKEDFYALAFESDRCDNEYLITEEVKEEEL